MAQAISTTQGLSQMGQQLPIPQQCGLSKPLDKAAGVPRANWLSTVPPS